MKRKTLALLLTAALAVEMCIRDSPYGASNNAARACRWTSRVQGQETAQFSHRFAEKEFIQPLRRRSRMPMLGEPGVTNECDGTAYAEG